MDEILAVFVYGTLKRGEQREAMWPHPPVEVRPATVRAALYDLGPYPAIAAGEDLVGGELWLVDAEHLRETLAALDDIECFGQGGVDLYVRRIVDARDDDGNVHRAHTYLYADATLLAEPQRILPNAEGRCHWTAARP